MLLQEYQNALDLWRALNAAMIVLKEVTGGHTEPPSENEEVGPAAALGGSSTALPPVRRGGPHGKGAGAGPQEPDQEHPVAEAAVEGAGRGLGARHLREALGRQVTPHIGRRRPQITTGLEGAATVEELPAIIRRGENQRTEFKAAEADSADMARASTAMANNVVPLGCGRRLAEG